MANEKIARTETLANFGRRKAAALAFYEPTFGDIHDHLDEIDRAVMSVLADLVCAGKSETIHTVAQLAKAAYLVRLAVPRPEVTP